MHTTIILHIEHNPKKLKPSQLVSQAAGRLWSLDGVDSVESVLTIDGAPLLVDNPKPSPRPRVELLQGPALQGVAPWEPK